MHKLLTEQTMKEVNIKCTGVALVTPFDKQSNVDFTSFG